MSLLLSQVDYVPETFADYTHREVLKRSSFVQSNVVVPSDAVLPQYGSTVTLPFWGGLEGDAEVLSDSSGLSDNNIASHSEVAPVLQRGKLYGYDDLAASFTASDPMGDLASKIGAFWTRELDKATMNAMIGAANGIGTDAVNTLGSGLDIDINAIIDTRAMFGEYLQEGMVIVLNATAYAKLQKDDVVDFVPDSNTNLIRTILEMPVILSETMPADTAAIVRPGALRYADGSDPRHVLEEDRDIASGKYKYSTRQRWGLGVTGATFDGSPAGATATNAELLNSANWSAVDDPLRFGARLIDYNNA